MCDFEWQESHMRVPTAVFGLVLFAAAAAACSSATGSSNANRATDDDGGASNDPSGEDSEGGVSGDGGGGGSGDGGVVAADGAVLPACTGASLATTPTKFALPPGYPQSTFVTTGFIAGCVDGASFPAFTTTDLDGDGVVDLVITLACDDAQVGTTKWRVHRGSAAGFAATAIDFALPPGFGNAAFIATAGSAVCNSSQIYPSFATLDVDHDRIPDLVMTDFCADAQQVGSTHWQVYKGSATGFSATATSFSLPAGFPAQSFIATADMASCANATFPAFATTDLDHDGFLDMVVTQSCSDDQVGTTNWQVYKGSASGFAATATAFALPTTLPAKTLLKLSDVAYCSNGNTFPAYTTMDIDHDGMLDLVVTQVCGDNQVGTTNWQVYKGGASGFAATATPFALPSNLPARTLLKTADASYCDNGDDFPAYVTLDIDRDGYVDLVLTNTCSDASVGTSRWIVYRGSSTGFAAASVDFLLPAGYPNASFDSLGGISGCTADGGGLPEFTTMDIDGDRLLDLTVTLSCADPTVGTANWLVYRGQCSSP